MKINKHDKGLPVLLAFEEKETGFLNAWCPFCVKFHLHGKGEGHRVAHCDNPESPFKETGYSLLKGDKRDNLFIEGKIKRD